MPKKREPFENEEFLLLYDLNKPKSLNILSVLQNVKHYFCRSVRPATTAPKWNRCKCACVLRGRFIAVSFPESAFLLGAGQKFVSFGICRGVVVLSSTLRKVPNITVPTNLNAFPVLRISILMANGRFCRSQWDDHRQPDARRTTPQGLYDNRLGNHPRVTYKSLGKWCNMTFPL